MLTGLDRDIDLLNGALYADDPLAQERLEFVERHGPARCTG